MTPQTIRVLAVDPCHRGLGFVVLEWPINLVDWGVKTVKHKKKRRTLAMIINMLRRYKPHIIVMEDCQAIGSRRCVRVHKLIGEICREAVKESVAVRVFSREQIKDVFAAFGAGTKYEIAHAIGRQLPELATNVPRYRRAWMNEDHRMPFFTATSLAMTYFYTRRLRTKKIS